MCSSAPNITSQFRERVGARSSKSGALTRKAFSAESQFITIGPRSEWHQATAQIGSEVWPFSVRSPLILPKPDATVVIRPFFEGSVTGDVLPRQPLQWSPDNTVVTSGAVDAVSTVKGDGQPLAFLEVIAYDAVPDIWPLARPDAEYYPSASPDHASAVSTEGVYFSCPVMGRRRLSVYGMGSSDVSFNYRFTGCWFEDDSLRETEILAQQTVATATPATGWSRHLNIDSDAFMWIKCYVKAANPGYDPKLKFRVSD